MDNKIVVLCKYKEKNNSFYNFMQNYNDYDDIIIYNKYAGDNLLPNIGREVHTILHHIIENYDKLSDEIFFAQYDTWPHLKLPSTKGYRNKKHLDYFLRAELYDFVGIRPGRWRKIINTDRGRMKFHWIEFYEKLFNKTATDLDKIRIISTAPTKYSSFRVSKRAILLNSKEFYEKCISLVEKKQDFKNIYYFEYMWRLLFTDYGVGQNIDNQKYNFLNNSYWLYGSDKCRGYLYKLQGNQFGPVFLHNSGVISGNNVSLYTGNNESFWKIDNNKLMFMRSDGGLTCVFDISKIKNTKDPIYGDFYFDKNTIYRKHLWLKPINLL